MFHIFRYFLAPQKHKYAYQYLGSIVEGTMEGLKILRGARTNTMSFDGTVFAPNSAGAP